MANNLANSAMILLPTEANYMTSFNSHLKRLSKVASVRLTELREEEKEILRLFPKLQRATASGSSKPAATRRRSRLSPAARKAVSLRMKKYWAERRRVKAKY